MAKSKPLNTAPGDFGATAEAEAKARARELLSATEGPAPEDVERQHELARLADRQRQAGAGPDGKAIPAAADGPLRRYRVSLEGVSVLALDEQRGVHVRQGHLDVQAASEWGAVREFARYNGIPVARDPLTNQEQLASVHRPRVELLGD